jgi:putative ABC transport system permease protein
MAVNMVANSQLRSWLTILGIVIGVASVIAILSIGDGLEARVNEQLGGLGSDIITITPGFSQAQTMRPGGGLQGPSDDINNAQAQLTRTDVQSLKSIPEIQYIDTNIQGKAEVYYLGKSAMLTIKGVDQKVWHQITSDELHAGRLLGPSDQNVVVIGYTIAKDYFDEEIGINKIVSIDERSYRVVGITAEGSSDKVITMPLQAAYQIIDDKEVDVYDSLTVKVTEGSDVELISEKIESRLMITRHVTDKDKDFTVVSMKQLQEDITDITGTITVFLGAIAAVALIVGAVGIANTMFTSVLEKTKQIGIMKAIGARNEDILKIFLINSGLIGLVGGVIGVILGYLISLVVPYVMPRAADGTMMLTVVSLEVVALSLVASILVGMIAGLIPARSGSKLKPVDALRFE